LHAREPAFHFTRRTTNALASSRRRRQWSSLGCSIGAHRWRCQFTHFFAVILWVAAGLAFSADAFEAAAAFAARFQAFSGHFPPN
jgi:hypothetical protein